MKRSPFHSGESVARVDERARRRDHWIPVIDRLLHTFLSRAYADLEAGVVDTVGDNRPTIIAARLRVIKLVATHCAVLHSPELACLRMQGCGLHVAVTIGPDLGPRVFAPYKRVVVWNRAVRIDPDDLPKRSRKILCPIAVIITVARCDE